MASPNLDNTSSGTAIFRVGYTRPMSGGDCKKRRHVFISTIWQKGFIQYQIGYNSVQSKWEIFMEQELRFGPVWQLLRPVFSCFHGQKIFFKNILDGENIFGTE